MQPFLSWNSIKAAIKHNPWRNAQLCYQEEIQYQALKVGLHIPQKNRSILKATIANNNLYEFKLLHSHRTEAIISRILETEKYKTMDKVLRETT